MSSLATAANVGLSKSAEVIVPVMVPSAGIVAYVKSLPAASLNLLMNNIKQLPASERKGAMIAGCSCWGNGTPVDPTNTEYAALLAKAKPTELASLFRTACHVNGYAELEFLKVTSPDPTAPSSIPAAEAPQAS